MQKSKACLLAFMSVCVFHVGAAELETAPVKAAQGEEIYVAEGVVEAVRQSSISPQVAGRILQLSVKAGDSVQKGQVLVRIDSQAATQQARASGAQVLAAQAQLDVARKELQRQQHLFQKQYISQAALDQAEAQFKATEAAVRGTSAQANAARTQTGFFTLTAPYNGIVASVPAEIGDMAMPGSPILTLYDPQALRVVAPLPQSKASQLASDAVVRLELTALPQALRWQQARTLTVLPTADPASQTVSVRMGLPPLAVAVTPGMFARAYFPLTADQSKRLLIPSRAVIHRTELTAVYVLAPGDKVQLRQVRLGRPIGDEVEVLAGLHAGELVALDPIAAANVR